MTEHQSPVIFICCVLCLFYLMKAIMATASASHFPAESVFAVFFFSYFKKQKHNPPVAAQIKIPTGA